MSLTEQFADAEEHFKENTFVMARYKNIAGVSQPEWVLEQSYVAHSGDLPNHHSGGFSWTKDADKAVRFKEGQDVQSEKGPLSAWLILERGAFSFKSGSTDFKPASLAQIDEMRGK